MVAKGPYRVRYLPSRQPALHEYMGRYIRPPCRKVLPDRTQVSFVVHLGWQQQRLFAVAIYQEQSTASNSFQHRITGLPKCAPGWAASELRCTSSVAATKALRCCYQPMLGGSRYCTCLEVAAGALPNVLQGDLWLSSILYVGRQQRLTQCTPGRAAAQLQSTSSVTAANSLQCCCLHLL